MKVEDKKLINKIMKEETKGLNMKFKGARNKLIFSYQDVVVILEKLLKEKRK